MGDENEKRCYECGCCDITDGWCNLVVEYGFNVNECNVPEEEKHKHSHWHK